MTYFKNITNIEELKKQYKKLAIENHPDNGGSNEIMSEINNEFKQIAERLSLNKTNIADLYYNEVHKEASRGYADWLDAFIKEFNKQKSKPPTYDFIKYQMRTKESNASDVDAYNAMMYGMYAQQQMRPPMCGCTNTNKSC